MVNHRDVRDCTDGRLAAACRLSADVVPRLRTDGFAFVSAEMVLPCVTPGASWAQLAAAWHRLPADQYLRAGPQFRRRRYGRFIASSSGPMVDRPHAPYRQSVEHNSYAGGIDRHYPPIEDETKKNAVFGDLIRLDLNVVSANFDHHRWDLDVHLFRIVANSGTAASPTPEGVHRDGNCAFAVHLIYYQCSGGSTGIYDYEMNQIYNRMLMRQADTLYVDDSAVLHDVSLIRGGDAGEIGIRDVMIVDFYRSS
jgi:hypothetical protein